MREHYGIRPGERLSSVIERAGGFSGGRLSLRRGACSARRYASLRRGNRTK